MTGQKTTSLLLFCFYFIFFRFLDSAEAKDILYLFTLDKDCPSPALFFLTGHSFLPLHFPEMDSHHFFPSFCHSPSPTATEHLILVCLLARSVTSHESVPFPFPNLYLHILVVQGVSHNRLTYFDIS